MGKSAFLGDLYAVELILSYGYRRGNQTEEKGIT
jgi:hypothetical protein